MFSSATKSAGPSGYNLTKSLRFRSDAVGYLSRTPGSTGNRTTFTYSVWVKRGKLGSLYGMLSGTGTGTNNYNTFRFNTDYLQVVQFQLQ